VQANAIYEDRYLMGTGTHNHAHKRKKEREREENKDCLEEKKGEKKWTRKSVDRKEDLTPISAANTRPHRLLLTSNAFLLEEQWSRSALRCVPIVARGPPDSLPPPFAEHAIIVYPHPIQSPPTTRSHCPPVHCPPPGGNCHPGKGGVRLPRRDRQG
jgi:hypothetical protein